MRRLLRDAGAGQRELVARQEAGGAEPRTLLTDCPGAVSEDGRDESRTHQHTCPELYRQLRKEPFWFACRVRREFTWVWMRGYVARSLSSGGAPFLMTDRGTCIPQGRVSEDDMGEDLNEIARVPQVPAGRVDLDF